MKRIHPAHLLVHMQFKIFVRNASGPKSVWHRQTTFSAGLFCLYSVSCRNIPTSAGLVVSQSAHASSWLRCFLPFSANKFTDRSERNIDQSRSHSAYQYSSITNDCPWYLSASWVRRSNRWHFSPPLVPALRAKKAHPSLEWRSQDDEILKDIENISDDFDLSNLTPRPATCKLLLILPLVCLICGRHCTVNGFSPVCTLVICRFIHEGGLFFIVGEQWPLPSVSMATGQISQHKRFSHIFLLVLGLPSPRSREGPVEVGNGHWIKKVCGIKVLQPASSSSFFYCASGRRPLLNWYDSSRRFIKW